MESLVEILRGKETDKVENGLAQIYDDLFWPIRLDVEEMLEIGVDRGGSILGWLEFFPNATIHGYDIRDCDIYDNRFCMWTGDITKLDEVRRRLSDFNFDIIIDDGSHLNRDVINAFVILWPYLKKGGYYVVEDIQVPFRDPDYPTIAAYFETFAQHRDVIMEFEILRYNLLYVRKS